jgi:hypothetical protein
LKARDSLEDLGKNNIKMDLKDVKWLIWPTVGSSGRQFWAHESLNAIQGREIIN